MGEPMNNPIKKKKKMSVASNNVAEDKVPGPMPVSNFRISAPLRGTPKAIGIGALFPRHVQQNHLQSGVDIVVGDGSDMLNDYRSFGGENVLDSENPLAALGGSDADLIVVNTLLDRYVKCGPLDSVRKVFDEIRERDIIYWTSLFDAYPKASVMDRARELFRSMPVKDMVAWTAMVPGFAHNDQPREAPEYFPNMHLEGKVLSIGEGVDTDLTSSRSAHVTEEWTHASTSSSSSPSPSTSGEPVQPKNPRPIRTRSRPQIFKDFVQL